MEITKKDMEQNGKLVGANGEEMIRDIAGRLSDEGMSPELALMVAKQEILNMMELKAIEARKTTAWSHTDIEHFDEFKRLVEEAEERAMYVSENIDLLDEEQGSESTTKYIISIDDKNQYLVLNKFHINYNFDGSERMTYSTKVMTDKNKSFVIWSGALSTWVKGKEDTKVCEDFVTEMGLSIPPVNANGYEQKGLSVVKVINENLAVSIVPCSMMTKDGEVLTKFIYTVIDSNKKATRKRAF